MQDVDDDGYKSALMFACLMLLLSLCAPSCHTIGACDACVVVPSFLKLFERVRGFTVGSVRSRASCCGCTVPLWSIAYLFACPLLLLSNVRSELCVRYGAVVQEVGWWVSAQILLC